MLSEAEVTSFIDGPREGPVTFPIRFRFSFGPHVFSESAHSTT